MLFKHLIFISLCLLYSLNIHAAVDSTGFTDGNSTEFIEDSVKNENSIYDLPLSELLELQIEVTGHQELSLRESPGIVTVITEYEIQTSGARDMQDVLRLVPGFEFAGDVENSVSIGVRGNWAMEGKVLFMIDGLQINETGYGSIIFGNRFLLDNIKKIEIIRGPGSAIYGGAAELAVINIITKTGVNMEGGYASTSYGFSNGSTSRINGQFGVGTINTKGLDISLTGALSKGNRSNETVYYNTNPSYTSNKSASYYNYSDSSMINSFDINLGAKYKGFEFKTIYQHYDNSLNNSNADWAQLGGIYMGLKYNWKLSNRLTLMPSINWKKEKPWTYRGNVSDEYIYYTNHNYRSIGKLSAVYDLNDHININIGGEFQSDLTKYTNDSLLFSNNKSSLNYSNYALFGELVLTNKIANFILGARYDNHSQFSDAFVPRLAITKSWNKFHLKGLISRAFRAPLFNNFELNPDIKPEFTNVVELELGLMINEHNAVIGNLFHITIENPIIYNDNSFIYSNATLASTVGFELVHKLNYKWGYVNSSYSFYRNNNTQAEAYLVEDNPNLLKGFPAHKIATSGGLYFGEKLIIAPTIIYNSEKGGNIYQGNNTTNSTPVTHDANLTINCAAHYDIFNSLRLTFGAYDILNDTYTATSSYDPGGSTPFLGREFRMKAQFKF